MSSLTTTEGQEQNVQTSLASLKPTDILISPELGDFSTGDFDHLSKITPTGEAAARKLADRLAQMRAECRREPWRVEEGPDRGDELRPIEQRYLGDVEAARRAASATSSRSAVVFPQGRSAPVLL